MTTLYKNIQEPLKTCIWEQITILGNFCNKNSNAFLAIWTDNSLVSFFMFLFPSAKVILHFPIRKLRLPPVKNT